MAQEIKWCEVSAFTLALSIVAENPELANKIADLSEYANAAALRHDALIEGAMQWMEWDIKQIAHHYSLKEESANMKLSAAIFWWVFANSRQWDEALQIIADEIAKTAWTSIEWLDLYRMIQNLDLSSINEIAKSFTNWNIEEAKIIVEDIKSKLSYYVWSEYSVVRSGSKVKIAEEQKRLEKELNDANKQLDEARKVVWDKKLKQLDKDYETIQKIRDGVDNKINWKTAEWKAKVQKIGAKYWINSQSAKTVGEKLQKLVDAKNTIDELSNTTKILQKEYDDAMKWDLKLIADNKNPINMVSWDEEWRFIKDFNAAPSDRVMQYGQYVLSRALLTSGRKIPQAVYDVIVNSIKAASWGSIVNFLDEKLTEDWILDESRTLEELMARAYTNALDLVEDGNLRNIYRQRLIELTSSWAISLKDVDYIESLMNTLDFAKAWAWFSDVLKYTELLSSASWLWLKVPWNDWRALWDSIINLFKRDDFEKALTWDFVKLWNGMELSSRQLLELVSDMLNNISINELIASGKVTDRTVLDVAWKYLIWDAKQWWDRLLSLFDMAKTAPSTDDTRWIILKTITWWDVPTDANVGFFDFRKWLNATETTKARAEFQERLAQANTLTIPSNRIDDITDSLEKRISKYKGWYILVNDSQWRLNERLVNALDAVNHWADWKLLPAEERVQVICPTGWLMWTISSKWWKIVYRTSYTQWFNELVRKVAIRSLWQSSVDTKFTEELQKKLLRWDIDTLKEYNDLLEADAKKYFWAMLWVWKEAYDDKLPALLEEMTGISFKNYSNVTDKVSFWKKVDSAFMLWMKTVGDYEQEITTIAEITKEIDSLTPERFINRLNQFYGFEFKPEQITKWWKIRQEIKDAYLNYQLAQTPLELLERKGKLLAVINWWEADTINITQFKSMLQSWDFTAYKDLFFHNLNLSDEELNKYIKKINDMIFDSLCAQAAMNLVDIWYQLPLANIKDLVYDYLMDKLNVNWTFARAFLYKNWLPDNLVTLKSIVNEAMPSDLRFWYDDGFKLNLEDVKNWNVDKSLISDWYTRIIEVPNKFVQDTYSSLIAMAAVKNWDKLPWIWQEAERLQEILDNYFNAFSQKTEWWKTLSFYQAQKLKMQAWYALDMFEQDYLYPRYKQFITPQERQELFWLKYWLAITTDADWLWVVKDYNKSVMQRYLDATYSIAQRNEIISTWLWWKAASFQKELEKRQKQLMEEWATLKNIWWSLVVVDTRDELLRQLKSIPNTIAWLENLRAMWRVGLNQLSNEEAYFLLNVVELAKNADNKANMIMQTIYKVNPQLARIDFFNTYKSIDWIPKMLQWNLLESTKYLSQFNNTFVFDQNVKKTILRMIKEEFSRSWTLLRTSIKDKKWNIITRWLDKIVDDAIALHKWDLSNSVKWLEWRKFKKNASMVYVESYSPYTYLQDVPKVIKDSIWNILLEQEKWIRQALDLLWDSNKLTDIMDNISIYTQDWTVKTFREMLDWWVDDINKIVFNTDSAIIWEADVVSAATINPKASAKEKLKTERQNKKIITEIENNYRDWLQAYLNNSEIVSKWERELTNTILVAARECAKKYTLTNKFVETDNALASINEEIIRRFKSDILWFWWLLTKGWQLMWWIFDLWWKISQRVMDRWKLVQDRYKYFYQMSLDQLANVSVSWSIDAMALDMVKYFKEMEQRLWSLDWLKWVSTDIEINKAFAHIWEVVMNIETLNWLYSLMSWIEWNQFLKFFRYSNSNQPSYVKRFVIWDEWKETLWWFRTYVDRTDEGLNRERFNKTFWANFTDREYSKVIQALTWFTIINKKFKILENALNFMNTSNFLFRTLVSYPWQLVTIGNQSIAYFLRQIGWEKELWIEDLGAIDAIRHSTWILNWTYNELNIWEALKRVFSKVSPDDVNPFAYYNRYWVPDVDNLMKNEKFYTTDDLNTIYSKIDNYWATRTWWDKLDDLWTRFLRNVDAYKDNANNIIDWLFARNFKNIAFVRALQSNQVMRFATADQFARFMAWDAPEVFKKRVMDAVTAESWRNFRNILWLGFSWLDRALWYWPISNTLVGMAQILNFRWAWWMNIARQTNNIFMTALKIWTSWMSKEAKDAAATLLAKNPEFVNFTSQLFNDLKNSRKLVRYQDNWQIPPEDESWSLMDFVDYATQNMKFASQRWQWIQSYWTARVWLAWLEGAYNNRQNPEIYRDTLWIWAFFNALAKDAWRNRKAPNFMMKVFAVWTSQWPEKAWTYLQNEWWKMSFWTLRYLMNEDETDYWRQTEMPQKKTWIPFIITWEADETWDKAFSYDLAWTETFQNLSSWYDAVQRGDTDAADVYAWNLIDTAFNSSQMFGVIKNTGKMLNWLFNWKTISWFFNDLHMYEMWNPFSSAEAADIIWETEAWAAFLKDWYYIPNDADWMKTFINVIIWQSDYRPWNWWFNKSLFNFDKSWHMKNYEESNEKDAPMELLLNNMKYKRDENWWYVLDDKWNRIVTDYWKQHMYDITGKAYDEDLMTKMNFDFINNWVEANSKDPNYMLYKRLIWEWIAWNYLENEANRYMSLFNTVEWLKKTQKLKLSEMKDSVYYDEFIPYLLATKISLWWENVPFAEALATLDKTALMEADIAIIEDQLSKTWQKDVISKFFNVDRDTWDVTLSTKYKSFIEEQAKLSWYLQKWDLDSFMAETASVTKMFKKDDPYWLMTSALISSRVNWINQSTSITPEQKAKAINVLFVDNADFIQQHIPEMIDSLWDAAEAYITQMNEFIYWSNIIANQLVEDNETTKSSSWRKAALNASDLTRWILNNLSKASGGSSNIWPKKYNYNFVPVKLDWAKLLKAVWWQWYTWGWAPRLANIQAYKPHIDLSLAKDINRNVKWPKTQQISNKKQLSNLESKVTKALEAES